MRLAACVAAATLLASRTSGEDTSWSGARVKFPYVNDENSPLFNVSISAHQSEFGYQDYGGYRVGWLVLPYNESYRLECTEEPYSENEYIEWVRGWNPTNNDETWIMLIDRGDCYFVTKVENAQKYGATAVIVLDTKDEKTGPDMWPPEGYDDQIEIPSVLLDHYNSSVLMTAMGVENWGNDNVVYPSSLEWNYTVAWLEWGLPRPDDRVEYELWTSSNDPDVRVFRHNWRDTAVSFEGQNYTLFTPHFYLINGTEYGCHSESVSHLSCGYRCTNMGRYCAPDDAYNEELGIRGMDVVTENLRQACLWKSLKEKEMNDSIWWDYTKLWDQYCHTDNPNTFNVNCSETQMVYLSRNDEQLLNNPDYNIINEVNQCILDSGSVDYNGGVNTILSFEIDDRYTKGVRHMPVVTVNEYEVYGNIDCDEILESKCQVLDAICAGFIQGTEPDKCHYTPSPTWAECEDEQKDCNGHCYGIYELDACNQCLLPSDERFDDCVGCDDIPYSNQTLDCKDECGGNYRINDCGLCLDPTILSEEEFDNEGKDCSGICMGESDYDQCGQCLAMNDDRWNNCEESDDNGGGNSDDKSEKSAFIAVIVISVVSVILLALAGFCLWKMWMRQKQVDGRMAEFSRRYQIMDTQATEEEESAGADFPRPTDSIA